MEPHRRELVACRQIGYFDIDLPCPQLAGHLCEWWDHALGEVAVPLGPGGVLTVGEIKRVNDIAALPAVVWWRVALR